MNKWFFVYEVSGVCEKAFKYLLNDTVQYHFLRDAVRKTIADLRRSYEDEELAFTVYRTDNGGYGIMFTASGDEIGAVDFLEVTPARDAVATKMEDALYKSVWEYED